MSMYPFYRSCNKILRKYIQTKLRKLKYAIMKVKKKMEIKIIFDYKLRQTDRQRKLKFVYSYTFMKTYQRNVYIIHKLRSLHNSARRNFCFK